MGALLGCFLVSFFQIQAFCFSSFHFFNAALLFPESVWCNYYYFLRRFAYGAIVREALFVAYRANITSSPSLLFKHKAMDGWMVGWLEGWLAGWMDGNDVDEFLWNQALKTYVEEDMP